MIKKQLLALTFAVFALNAAGQTIAEGNGKVFSVNYKNYYDMQNINNVKADRFFLPYMLASANLDKKLSSAHTASLGQSAPKAYCNSVQDTVIKNTIINKIKTFDLEKEYKKVKSDTQIVKIDYSKVRPHLHKRKILAAVKSEAQASKEISEKKETLRRVSDNFKLIANKARTSDDSRKNRDLLCLVDRALYAVKKTDYILALEITKQAVNK